MELTDWAEDHTRRLLSPLGRRWRHAEAVAERARELANRLVPEDRDVLVAAAYLHDIGYAPQVAATGFHPLDGARHLRALGHQRIAGLVAHHTGARHEARLRGLHEELTEFEDEASLISVALAYCDLTTGPSGERMTPAERLLDVAARYGEESPVTGSLRAGWSELMDAVGQVEALLDGKLPAAVQPR